VLRHHRDVWDPIRVTHLGQRSYDRTTKAGHMTAFDQIIIALPRPCETGAVHIWVPGSPRGVEPSAEPMMGPGLTGGAAGEREQAERYCAAVASVAAGRQLVSR